MYNFVLQDRRRAAGQRSPSSAESGAEGGEEGGAGVEESSSQEQLQSACGPLQVATLFSTLNSLLFLFARQRRCAVLYRTYFSQYLHETQLKG